MKKFIQLFISLNLCLCLLTGCASTGENVLAQLESISRKNNTPLDLDSTERTALIKALNNLPQETLTKLSHPLFLNNIKLPLFNPFNDHYSPENAATLYMQSFCAINSIATSS